MQIIAQKIYFFFKIIKLRKKIAGGQSYFAPGNLMKAENEDYARLAKGNRLGIVFRAYNKESAFYESCGFKKAENECPMFITSLWT